MKRWLVLVGLVLTTGCSATAATADAISDVAQVGRPGNVYTQESPPTRAELGSAEKVDHLDVSETRAKLAQVDIAHCGSRHREGRAQIMYGPDGVLAAVVIDEPEVIERKVVQCVGQRLGRVTVPPFRGGTVAFDMPLRL